MSNILNTQALESMGAQFVILGVDDYALPVRFRVRGAFVECRVPIWSGVSDSFDKKRVVTLVAIQNSEPYLRWLFLRGEGSIVKDPDWEGLVPLQPGRVDPEDLYWLVRIVPKRMELFDEQRGWGFRETTDF